MNSDRLKTPFPRSYWIIPGLFLAGEFPGAKDYKEAKDKIRKLYDCGIRKFINLMEPSETDHSGKPFIDYAPMVYELSSQYDRPSFHRFPIPDLKLPSNEIMAEILNTIETGIEVGAPVYVHCWGGVGRTGTVIGCFLLRNGLASPNTVLDIISELRKNDPKRYRTSPETPKQCDFVKTWLDRDYSPPTKLSRSVGCLLGGAVGDALGAPVEFIKRDEILRNFGPAGITTYAPAYGSLGLITDDTQMTLFTAEGLLRAEVRGRHKGISNYASLVAHAYQRWLYTQNERLSPDICAQTDGEGAGWLLRQQALHNRRAPGNTCISALKSMRETNRPANNNSKGCGGVMRMAPVGLYHWRKENDHSPAETFELGNDLAALTHGHPTGAVTGGVLAVIIRELCDGSSLADALSVAKALLRREQDHQETLRAIELAEELSATGKPDAGKISRIGQGWIAEEALAISIYCALVARDFREGVIRAVNHDGDSDSTGAITGNLLGAMYGANAIPQEWIEPLELKNVITEIATDLHVFHSWNIGEYSTNHELNRFIWQKYPGY